MYRSTIKQGTTLVHFYDTVSTISDNRNNTTFAISSGFAIRPAGIKLSENFLISGSLKGLCSHSCISKPRSNGIHPYIMSS